jgi:hypothetical protein
MPQTAVGYDSSSDLMRELTEERAIVHRLKEWFRHAYETSVDWRQRAIEAYRFCSNLQWEDADLSRLRAERRPALTINKVLAPVLFLAGAQRQQRTEVKLLGFEAGDYRKAELMQALVKWVGQQSREEETDSHVFMDKIVTGLGFWKLRVDFMDDPSGMICWERVSPLAVFIDPNWIDNGWKAARYCFHALWRDLEELIDEYPEREDAIRQQFGEWINGEGRWGGGMVAGRARGEEAGDSFATRRMFWDAETQRARVLECWYSETQKVEVAYDNVSGDVITDPQQLASLKQAVAAQPGLQQRVQVMTRPVRQIKVAHLLNEVLLDNNPSPYSHPVFPIFPAMGYQFWEHPFGIVEPMKDPQREINRRRSSIIEIVRRMPHAGWMNHRTQGAKTEDLEKYAKGSGYVINYESQPPVQAAPPELSQTLVYLERANATEIRDVVNINAELTGNTTQRTVSGRAIEARQRGGMTVQEPLMESFDNEKQEAVLFLVKLIQQFVPLQKAVRILGAMVYRDPTGQLAQMMQQGQDPAGTPQGQMDQVTLMQTLSAAFNTHFDVYVKSQPFHPSVQAEKWDNLTELAQTPFGQAIPPQALIEAGRAAGFIDDDVAQMILGNIQQQQQQAAVQQQAQQNGLQAAAKPPGAPPQQGPPPTLQ